MLGQSILSFANATALISNLHVGEFLIADPNPGGYQPMIGTSNSLVQNAPFEVQSVFISSNAVTITGRQRELTALIQSGTFIGASANFNGSGEQTLAHIALPAFQFNLGGVPCEVAPELDFRVGAAANGPEQISIPIRSSISVGSEVGWTSDDGAYFRAPVKGFSAPHVSDPTAFSTIAAEASAWAEAEFSVKVGVYGGLLAAGPTLAVRTDGRFAVAPFADPWWSLDLSASLLGGLELDILGVNMVDTRSSIVSTTFFHRDAGGTVAQTVPENVRTNSVAPKTGRTVRWAQAFQATHVSNSGIYDDGFVVPLPDGGCIIGGSSHFMGFMARLNSTGDFLWLQNTERVLGFTPKDAVLQPDGAIAVAGQSGSTWWVAGYDLDGQRLWVNSFSPAGGGILERISLGRDGAGQPLLFVAGSAQAPLLLTFSTNGVQIGGLKMNTSDFTLAHSVLGLQNGGCVLVGRSDADITNGLLGDYGLNAMITKVNPDLTVAWTRVLAGATEYWDVAEGPDGALYAVGNGGDTIRNRHPDILVTKFNRDGDILGHVVIGEDPDWASEFTNRVDTPLDTAWQVKWTANGLMVVGSTGLGGTLRGWVAQLTEELGVSWFTGFDNGSSATFYDVAPTTNGLYVMGWSGHLWPTLPGTDQNGILLMSLPWEGLMRFKPDSGLQARHLQPRIFECTGSSDFFVGANAAYWSSPAWGVTNLTTAAANPFALATFTNVTSVRLERLPTPAAGSYQEWLATYGLSGAEARPTADPDGDGSNNAAEYFFGGNPVVSDAGAARLAIDYQPEQNRVGLEFQRSRLAVNRPFWTRASTNLVEWWDVTDAPVQIVAGGASNRTDRLRVTLPGPASTAYFRLRIEP